MTVTEEKNKAKERLCTSQSFFFHLKMRFPNDKKCEVKNETTCQSFECINVCN